MIGTNGNLHEQANRILQLGGAVNPSEEFLTELREADRINGIYCNQLIGHKKDMSLLQTAFIEKSRVPNREKLEEAVHAIGFDLNIDECYQPFNCSGFLPCVLKGKKSGFEIYFESPNEALQFFPHLKEKIGSRDCTICFRWGGDMAECACVLIVSAALAKNFEAVVHYADDDLLYSAEQLVEEANGALHHLEAAPPPRQRIPSRIPKKPWWKLW